MNKFSLRLYIDGHQYMHMFVLSHIACSHVLSVLNKLCKNFDYMILITSESYYSQGVTSQSIRDIKKLTFKLLNWIMVKLLLSASHNPFIRLHFNHTYRSQIYDFIVNLIWF